MKKRLITHKNSSILAVILFAFILIFLPGQNQIQLISIKPEAQKVLGAEKSNISRADLPSLIDNHQELGISPKSAIAIDVESAVVLYQNNPDLILPPASTTKILTALIALEEYELDDVVEINNENFSIGNKSHIQPGEKLTVKSLLYALLVSSGNDAALALAQHHPKGYVEFINLMNKKAQNLHLVNSNFTNVSGLEQITHHTTARDLALLTKEAIKDPLFSKIVSQKKVKISSVDKSFSHILENTNQLLGAVDGVVGVKTGWTEFAGECLVTFVQRDGRQIITVVLGSEDRFKESKALIEWVFNNYTWKPFPNIE